MKTTLKMLAAGGLVAAAVTGTVVASSTPASAQWCRWHYCGGWGGPFAAGVLGGLAVGAIAGAATAPYYYAPPPPCHWVHNPYPYDAYGNWIGYRRWVCY